MRGKKQKNAAYVFRHAVIYLRTVAIQMGQEGGSSDMFAGAKIETTLAKTAWGSIASKLLICGCEGR